MAMAVPISSLSRLYRSAMVTTNPLSLPRVRFPEGRRRGGAAGRHQQERRSTHLPAFVCDTFARAAGSGLTTPAARIRRRARLYAPSRRFSQPCSKAATPLPQESRTLNRQSICCATLVHLSRELRSRPL